MTALRVLVMLTDEKKWDLTEGDKAGQRIIETMSGEGRFAVACIDDTCPSM